MAVQVALQYRPSMGGQGEKPSAQALRGPGLSQCHHPLGAILFPQLDYPGPSSRMAAAVRWRRARPRLLLGPPTARHIVSS